MYLELSFRRRRRWTEKVAALLQVKDTTHHILSDCSCQIGKYISKDAAKEEDKLLYNVSGSPKGRRCCCSVKEGGGWV